MLSVIVSIVFKEKPVKVEHLINIPKIDAMPVEIDEPLLLVPFKSYHKL